MFKKFINSDCLISIMFAGQTISGGTSTEFIRGVILQVNDLGDFVEFYIQEKSQVKGKVVGEKWLLVKKTNLVYIKQV